MKVLRLLVCLLAAVALAAPPLATQATPQAHPAGMDCHGPGDDRDHNHDHGHDNAKHTSHGCCPSMNGSLAVLAVAEIELAVQAIDHSPRASFVLSGLIPTKDPPPPRV